MLNLPRNKVYVVVPAYNEHAVMDMVCQELLGEGYNIVVVDDGSQPPLLEQIPSGIIYLQHAVNLGQGAALQTGMEYALQDGAELVASFDADGQHRVMDLNLMVEFFQTQQVDIILGSRFLSTENEMSLSRKWVLQMGRFVNFIFTGLLLSDAHNGLRVMNRKAASKMKLGNGMQHATDMLSIIRKERLMYREMPVSIRYTDYSKNKGQRGWAAFRIFIDLVLNKVFR